MPEAAFGGRVSYESSPFSSAIMFSLSSPVAYYSSVGTLPLEAMEPVSTAPWDGQALRACSARMPTLQVTLNHCSRAKPVEVS